MCFCCVVDLIVVKQGAMAKHESLFARGLDDPLAVYAWVVVTFCFFWGGGSLGFLIR